MNKKILKSEIKDLANKWNLYGITPDLQTDWLRLWKTYTSLDYSHLISVRQIGSLALLGSVIAMKNGNYSEAAEMWTPYVQHPDFATDQKDFHILYLCSRSDSYLHAGDIARALEGYWAALSSASVKEQATTAMLILEGIRTYCLAQDFTAAAEQKLIDCVEKVKTYAPKLARPPAANRPQTYAELAEETYHVDMVWED
jgi:hypothetical protein